jgi:hypothetical protein
MLVTQVLPRSSVAYQGAPDAEWDREDRRITAGTHARSWDSWGWCGGEAGQTTAPTNAMGASLEGVLL